MSGLFTKTAKSREKEFGMGKGDINNPESLAFFFMDSMMCHEHFLMHEDCLNEYKTKWFFTPGRNKLHK